MLFLNTEFYAIVNEAGRLEYDYDGPMIEHVQGPPGKWIQDSLVYLNKTSNKPHRIVKVKLIEVSS